MTEHQGNPTELQEGRDYTVERGLWVFTADYLKNRGYCCESGCRNCPYETSESEEELR